MDPLAAISFAGTVVQFVDFGTKILKGTREIYSSMSGTLRPNEELDLVLTDLSSSIEQLRHPPRISDGSSNVTEDQNALDALCEACLTVAKDLQKGLNELKGGGKLGKYDSLRYAMRSAWTESRRKELLERLDYMREALKTRTLVDLR